MLVGGSLQNTGGSTCVELNVATECVLRFLASLLYFLLTMFS